MPGYLQDDLPPEEVERQRALYGPFTQAVRELVDATIRTTVDDDEIRRGPRRGRGPHRAAAHEPARRAVRRPLQPERPRPAVGQPVVGLRNAVAPPLVIEHDPSANGDVWADFHLGAAYEGPPGPRARRGLGAGPRPGPRRGGRRRRQARHDRDAHAALPPGHAARRPARRGLDRPRRGHQDLGQGAHHRPGRRDRRGRGRLHPAPVGARGDRRRRPARTPCYFE